MEDTSPITNSNFFKVARAVDGDDLFRVRVEMALEISGYPKTRANLIHVTNQVVDSIVCTVEGTVNCDGVTDAQIVAAMETIPNTTPIVE